MGGQESCLGLARGELGVPLDEVVNKGLRKQDYKGPGVPQVPS